MQQRSETKELIQDSLEALVESVEPMTAAIAVTSDGHLIAGASRIEVPSKRLAAMGSTLMSLGNTVTKELGMGGCRNVISENEGGVAIFMSITVRIVLISLTDNVSSLGTLLSASRRYAADLGKELDRIRSSRQ